LNVRTKIYGGLLISSSSKARGPKTVHRIRLCIAIANHEFHVRSSQVDFENTWTSQVATQSNYNLMQSIKNRLAKLLSPTGEGVQSGVESMRLPK
jgi:hypothetical protein